MSLKLPFPATSSQDTAEARAGAILTIDLAALQDNYRQLQTRAAEAACAAVVKANAYGLGIQPVASALAEAGCRQFFVAQLDEGIALRTVLGDEPDIIILHGALPGTEAELLSRRLIPVLNSPGQLEAWAALARARHARLPAVLQFDTGMARFGMSPAELDTILQDKTDLAAIDLKFVMSHLACADEPANPANARQRDAFERMRQGFRGVPVSLAASSGIFLGTDYHYDLVRPGSALYGVAPQPGKPNPMQAVVRLQAKVAQIREVGTNTPVGYGHTYRAPAPARLATVSAGYADGFLRSAGNRGAAWFGDVRLPVVGRVSMDSIILDATAAPATLQPGALVDLIGPRLDLDTVAAAAGTIGYELLTSLGQRFHRHYIGA
jgi:alanine racemase